MDPSGVTYTNFDWRVLGLDLDFVWHSDPAPVRAAYHRHLLQVGAVDTLTGELIDHLEDIGTYDETLLIVTADHGITFRPGENNRMNPNDRTMADIAAVPLFIKLPGQNEGEVSDRNAESIDVLPTIVNVLGVDVDWTFDGSSLVDGSGRDDKLLIDTKSQRHLLPGRFLDAIGEAVERKYRFLNLASDPRDVLEGFYAVGEHAGLVGKRIERLETTSPISAAWVVEGADRFAAVDTSEKTLPAMVRATTDVDAMKGRAVVIGVNGTIGGVAESFRAHGKIWIEAAFPSALLQDGENDVSLYVLSDDGSARLVPSSTEQ